MSILSFGLSLGIFVLASTHDDTCYDKLEYVFKVMHRLSEVEKKLESNRQGDTFTRWGKSTCPNGTVLIYNGFAGGSNHLSIGGAANHICLHKHPTWNDQTEYKSRTNLIYGAEYQTHDTTWRALHDYEVPCAVCYVPSGNIVMIPGRNVCNEKQTLQYSGYLMSGHVTYKSATEFICVDDQPQVFPGTNADQNGRLLCFVYAKCGSLKCPPYEPGKKITCAVCSF